MSADHVGPGATPDAIDAHCLVCHAARPAHGDVIIARSMTVEASRLYARLHYSAELQSQVTPDRVAPGEEL